MHNIDIVHRDLKIDNILYNESVKIIDFGFSSHTFDKKLTQYCGTLNYMAPEIISKEPYWGKQIDIWALGILLYYLSVGKYPFIGYD